MKIIFAGTEIPFTWKDLVLLPIVAYFLWEFMYALFSIPN